MNIVKELPKATSDWVIAEFKQEFYNTLRFDIFDIGRLLLRNDLKGYKNEQWRKTVTSFFDDMMEPYWIEKSPFEDSIPYIDYMVTKLGLSVLDTDQHSMFETLLNRKLVEANNQFACRLSMNGQAQGLPEFKWYANCAKDSRAYSFSVVYGDFEYPLNNGKWKRVSKSGASEFDRHLPIVSRETSEASIL